MYVCMYVCTYVHVLIQLFLSTDFSIVKTKYAEMIACLPGNFEATIGTLQSQFSDSDICDILSMDSGHNQKILNCLIVKLKTKEDLLDFSNSLEKINGAHSSLEWIIRQIRKGSHFCSHKYVGMIYSYVHYT